MNRPINSGAPNLYSIVSCLVIATIAALTAGFAFAPALNAGITPEDFGWLTLARHLDTPLPLLHENVFFVYFYRPTGLLFWWLSGQGFGSDAWLQNGADLILHAIDAGLMAMLALRLLRDPRAGLAAGLLFACMPPGVGTAMWLSDRFDALALLFGLLALLCQDAASTRRAARPVMAVCLLLALTAKEVAFALAATMLLRLAWDWWALRRNPWRSAAWIVAAMLAAIALRLIAGTAADNAINGEDLFARMLRGIGLWWWRLPRALYGYAQVPLWISGLFALFAGVMLATVAVGLRQRQSEKAPAIVTGGGLLLLPCLLQWPIVALALTDEAGLISLNLRFYYLATAGLALLAAASVSGLRSRRVGSAIGMLLLALLGSLLLRTRDVAAHWTERYAAASTVHQRLAEQIGTHVFPPGCLIEIDAPSLDDDFRTHVDTIIKAGAPRGASIMGCVIFAGRPVYNTIVSGAMCSAAAWPLLNLNHENGHSMLAPVGNLCTLQFAQPDPALLAARAIRFSVGPDGSLR
ncbi:MAG: hypothetical protein ABI411_21150 [Tahibacter sp.]